MDLAVTQLCTTRPDSKQTGIDDKLIGRWVNEVTGIAVDIRENEDFFSENKAAARIARSAAWGANYAVHYGDFTCLYYITSISDRRMIWTLRRGTPSCLKGIFDREANQ